MGLANYLRAYRMKCAKELLKGTRKKVSVICKEVGYPNETYFCKIFRDLYGMTRSNTEMKEQTERNKL